MAITGHLAEFSLPEIFQFLDQGHKTGLLTIRDVPDVQPEQLRLHYIWFNQGRVVAAANRLDQHGLVSLISQRGWLGDRAATRLAQSCPVGTPMGLCLKSQGVLQAEQLKLLFYTQVMRQVCALFELKDGIFNFESSAALPTAEMTGLSAPAVEVTLAGLRALRDWSALEDKLPDVTSGLTSTITGKPQLKIDQMEWRVWEFTNGTTPLKTIANSLRLSAEKIQQIAFRLIVVGLAEEVPLVTTSKSSVEAATPAELSIPSAEPSNLSQSFLQNLVGFLRGKA
jgi:hypothetical protein